MWRLRGEERMASSRVSQPGSRRTTPASNFSLLSQVPSWLVTSTALIRNCRNDSRRIAEALSSRLTKAALQTAFFWAATDKNISPGWKKYFIALRRICLEYFESVFTPQDRAQMTRSCGGHHVKCSN